MNEKYLIQSILYPIDRYTYDDVVRLSEKHDPIKISLEGKYWHARIRLPDKDAKYFTKKNMNGIDIVFMSTVKKPKSKSKSRSKKVKSVKRSRKVKAAKGVKGVKGGWNPFNAVANLAKRAVGVVTNPISAINMITHPMDLVHDIAGAGMSPNPNLGIWRPRLPGDQQPNHFFMDSEIMKRYQFKHPPMVAFGGAEIGGAEIGGAEIGGAEIGGAEIGGGIYSDLMEKLKRIPSLYVDAKGKLVDMLKKPVNYIRSLIKGGAIIPADSYHAEVLRELYRGGKISKRMMNKLDEHQVMHGGAPIGGAEIGGNVLEHSDFAAMEAYQKELRRGGVYDNSMIQPTLQLPSQAKLHRTMNKNSAAKAMRGSAYVGGASISGAYH